MSPALPIDKNSKVGLLALACAALVCAAAPAFAQAPAGACQGRHLVTRLAGPHAVTKKPIADIGSLQNRMTELEASIRDVAGRDPNLSPAVVDALVAALKNGTGITERKMQRNESVQWMAYQPKPGEFDVITPACLQLKNDYDAFEIVVEVKDQVRPAPQPRCSITADRNCAAAGAAFTVDTTGSSPGAKVTMTSEGGDGRTVTEVNRSGERFTWPDPRSADTDVTFTVKAQGEPAPAQTAQTYRFLMPKVCGNIAFLGLGPEKTVSAAGSPQSCEKSVSLDRCVPTVPPPPVEEREEEVDADACEVSDWTARGFGFGYFPLGSDQERDVIVPGNFPGDERFGVTNGYGIGGSIERRFNERLGLEFGLLAGRGSSDYDITLANGDREADSHKVNFYALTVGPNFHLNGCSSVDVYVGPFIGYGGFGDPNYWAFDHHFNAAFSGEFIYGAQLGLDLPLRNGPWGFHTGLRWFKLEQDTDAGDLEVDPLIFELGFTYGF
jgi:hypothetical protein